MQVKDINYCMEMVGPNDNLQQAAEKMRYLDVGAMPVCDGNRLVGVETDRDITIRATADGKDQLRRGWKRL
jgi:CBS domain-containing protein